MADEWAYVRVTVAADKGKEPRVLQAPCYVGVGTDMALCVFCAKGFAALVNRVRCHIAGTERGVVTGTTPCPGPRLGDSENPQEFAARQASFTAARRACLSKNAELRAAADAKTQKRALDKATSPHTFVGGGAAGERPLKQKKLTDNVALRLKATQDLARGLIAAGIPANVLENVHMKRGLISVAEAGGDWRPPSRKELLGTLLDTEYERVRAATLEARSTTSRVGVVLVGDGATNVNREPILNVLSVQGNRVEFIKAQNCAGKVKDMRFIADDMIAVITAMDDPQSVVCVLMDNATRGAWPLIETACPWVVCGPCGPHVVDLLMEDIGKLPFFKQLFSKAQTLRVFVRGHGHVLAAYNTVKKTAIMNPAGTRFGSSVIGLQNLEKNREPLVSTFGAAAVLAAMAKVKNDKLEGEHGTVGALFTFNQQLVNSEDFWTEAAWASLVLKPMAKLLRFMEQDAPTASKVYQAWFMVQEAIEQLEGLPTDLKDSIIALIRYRWDYGFTIIQGAGYVLDPEYRLCEPPDECKKAFDDFTLKCYPAPVRRDYADDEAFEAAKDEHLDTLATIDRQLLDFQRGTGPWERPVVKHNARLVSAVDAWDMYGQQPLQRVALRALGCVSGACAAERGHKWMNFLLDKMSNRRDWDKTEKMLYVRANLELLTREVDYSSITNPMFEMDEVDEEPEQPCAWQEDTEDPALPVEVVTAAVKRSAARAAKLAENKEKAAAGAPRAVHATMEREEGRRAVRRPRTFDE